MGGPVATSRVEPECSRAFAGGDVIDIERVNGARRTLTATSLAAFRADPLTTSASRRSQPPKRGGGLGARARGCTRARRLVPGEQAVGSGVQAKWAPPMGMPVESAFEAAALEPSARMCSAWRAQVQVRAERARRRTSDGPCVERRALAQSPRASDPSSAITLGARGARGSVTRATQPRARWRLSSRSWPP